jgi:asparagine synthase (glutamine-hydrolysing)
VSAIAGIFHADGRPVQPPAVGRMLDAMAHRAPDGVSVWCNGNIGLGHGLLRTLPEGPLEANPLVDGHLAITADVRLDNRDELLAALGIADRSTSDAALVLAAYRRWAEDCPSRLLGDFAFALWDAQRAILVCARDHFGVKPFNYYTGTDRFAFASETKALLALGVSSRGVDEARMADFLASIVADSSSTFYAGILRLPPGHQLAVTPSGTRLRCYWRPQASSSRPDGDLTAQFLELFQAAVRSRLRGTGAVGAMLSGGLDSSSIACVARRILRAEHDARSLPTFSMVSDAPSARIERQSIDAVVAQGGFAPNYVASDELAPFAEFDRILTEQEGVFLAPGLALGRPIYRLAAERGVRVLLDGHGGDEVVSHGLGRLRELASSSRWLDLWREVQGEADTNTASALRLFLLHVTHFGPSAHILRPLARARMRALHHLRHSRRQEETRPSWSGFINPDLAARTDVAARHHEQRAALAGCASERERHLAAISSSLQAHALEVLDKEAAGAGVEARYPFWDKRLAEFCLALPSEAKLHGGWSRLILRRAMEGILPRSVQWRRDKQDFTPVLVRGMLEHHRPLLDGILSDQRGEVAGYVDLAAAYAAYRRIAERPEAASGIDVQAVWRTVALALWLRQLRNTAVGAAAAPPAPVPTHA